MDKLLVWLDGKKTYILAVICVSVPFAVQLVLIDPIVGNWILAIAGVFGFGGKYITDQAVKTESNLGVSITNNRVRKANK